MTNFFEVPPEANAAGSELFQKVLTGKNGLLVERIISHGHFTPDGEWYDQDRDEWVLVLEGSAAIGFEAGREVALNRGDHLFLPKKMKHRVLRTSSPCIWLAIHGCMEDAPV